MHHFLLVVCSNSNSILHLFQYITTFTVYLTACDLEMSFIFEKTVEITSHVCFAFRFICKHIDNTRYISRDMGDRSLFQTANVTFKVIQGHQSIGYTRFPISLPLQLCHYLAPFQRYYAYHISQNLDVTPLTQPRTHHFLG